MASRGTEAIRDTELYRYLFGIEATWTVEKLQLDLVNRRVDVWADHAEDLRWPCPECGVFVPYPNAANWYNATYDGLAKELKGETDAKQQTQLINQCWDILTEELPAFPALVTLERWIYQSYVQGVPPVDTSYYMGAYSLYKSR